MKKRIGNDIQFVWHIYRKSGESQVPESFTDKDVEVKLISPLQRTVTIEDVSIATGVVTFTFRGKHQVTLGNYVAVLQENKGENGMVTLDVVNAVTLVPHSYMEEDGDEGDVIEATSVELESEIGQGIDAYTKAETDALLEGKYDKVDGIRFLAEQRKIAVTDENGQATTTISPNEVQFEEENGTRSAEIWLNGGYLRLNDKYHTSPTGNKIATDLELAGKQDTINDLAAIRSGAQAGATAYQKPSTGIPATDLASDVQSDLAAIVGITEVIPAQASSDNKLADKNFVNSSIATNTANYISDNGQPFQSVEDLESYSGVLTNNDYAFVVGVDSVGNTTYSRYKYNASTQQWALEYILNNSSFTAEQWAAINSSITSGLVAKLSALPTNSELTAILNGKANKIPMPPVIHELVVEGTTQVSDVITLITGYFYPRTYTQINSNYANPAVIEFTVNYTGELRFTGRHENGGILEYIKAYVNGTLVETSTENIKSATLNFNVEANDVVKVEFTRYVTGNFTGCIGNLSITSAGVPKDLVDVYNSLASVATSGSYNDLSDKPDLSGFITNSVDNLVNYYLKSETYTKTEVQQLIGAIQQFHYEVYPTLPQTGANNVLYLIGPTGTGADKYEEYVYANNEWTKIGDTSIDLSGYVTTQALTTALADYVTSSALSVTLANYYNKTEVDGLFAGKENVMPITTATGATLSAVVGNYYRLDNVGTLAITLPTITGATKLQAITFLLVCGSSALVTFAPQGSETILYQEDFALEADTTYEVTALWNGSEWTLSRVIYE